MHVRSCLRPDTPVRAIMAPRLPHRFLAIALTCIATLAALLGPASAPVRADDRGNRFGPPWVGVIVADGAIAYSQPSLDSPPTGPLTRDARIPVVRVRRGGAGPDGDTTWFQMPNGFLPSAVVREYREPWVAEVVAAAVLYAYPRADSPIRRTVRTGDLLRVTGMSPGLDGDPNVWWSTTEGFVQLDALREATGEYARGWTMPQPEEAPNGWWGVVVDNANVRAGGSTQAPILGRLPAGLRVKVLGEEEGEAVGGITTWWRIDGGRYAGARVHSSLVRQTAPPRPNVTPPETMPANQTWITVDRTASTLTVVQSGSPLFVTYVSLGKTGRQTPTGEYATVGKYRYDDMTSASVQAAPGSGSYDLPNVPFTQYYKLGGYAVHGTYWHDGFGSPQSRGCINVTVTDGAYLFNLTDPAVAAGRNERWSGAAPATPVVITD